MPIYPSDPTRLSPSVFDDPVTKGLKTAGRWLGGEDPASQVMGVASPLGMTTTKIAPADAVQELLNVLTREPAAKEPLNDLGRATGTFVHHPTPVNVPKGFSIPPSMSTVGRAPDLSALYKEQQAGLKAAMSVPAPLQTISSPDELALTVGSPKPRTSAPALSGKWHATSGNNLGPATKLTPEVVKQIRQAWSATPDFPKVQQAFPDIKPGTLRAVVNGDSWGRVK